MLWFVLIIFIAAIVATISIGYDMKGDPPISPKRPQNGGAVPEYLNAYKAGVISNATLIKQLEINANIGFKEQLAQITKSTNTPPYEPTNTPQTDISPKMLLHRTSQQIFKIMNHYNNLYESLHYLKFICTDDLGKNMPKDENVIFLSEITDYTVSMRNDFIDRTEDILTVAELFTIYVDKLVDKGVIELRDYNPALLDPGNHEADDSLEYNLHYINVSANKMREFRKIKDKNVS